MLRCTMSMKRWILASLVLFAVKPVSSLVGIKGTPQARVKQAAVHSPCSAVHLLRINGGSPRQCTIEASSLECPEKSLQLVSRHNIGRGESRAMQLEVGDVAAATHVGLEMVLRGGGGHRRSSPTLMANALTAGKSIVAICGAMWCYGCVHGLWSVASVAVAPGGLEWIQDQSSHGLLGVSIFVAFTTALLFVQLYKLWNVLVATSLSQVKSSFLSLALFNIFFVYMCTWRVSPVMQRLNMRDSIILAEALCMVGLVVLYWVKQPWRGKGRKISG